MPTLGRMKLCYTAQAPRVFTQRGLVRAYLTAVQRFLGWAERRRLELARIAPKDVGQYIDGLRKENTSIATRSGTSSTAWSRGTR